MIRQALNNKSKSFCSVRLPSVETWSFRLLWVSGVCAKTDWNQMRARVGVSVCESVCVLYKQDGIYIKRKAHGGVAAFCLIGA